MKRIANMLGVLAVLLLLVLPLAVSAEEVCNHNSWAPMPVKNATCTEPGTVEGVWCSVCHFILDPPTETAPATGHDWAEEYATDTEPTCTEAGSKSIHCSRCDAVKDAEPIPASGHKYETVPGKEPTCTETGLTDGSKCAVCGTLLKEQETIDMLPHTPGQKHDEKAANHFSAGNIEYYDCTGVGTGCDKKLNADGNELSDIVIPKREDDVDWNFRWEGNCVVWDPVEGADHYSADVFMVGSGGFGMADVNGTSTDISKFFENWEYWGPGTYYIKVTAYSGREYITSPKSPEKVYAAPVVDLGEPTNAVWDGAVARWDAAEYAECYIVTLYKVGWKNPVEYYDTEDTEYDLSEELEFFGSGTYHFEVQSYRAKNYKGPAVSDTIEYTAENEFPKVQNPHWDGYVAKWDPVENAKGYDIVIAICQDSISYLSADPSVNFYDFSDEVVKYGCGQYSFEVAVYLDDGNGGWSQGGWSDTSDTIVYHKSIKEIPKVEPTCTSTGLTAGSKCNACHEVVQKQEVIDKLPHTPGQKHDEKPATYVSEGTVEYYDCTGCDAKLDADGKELADIVIPAREVDWNLRWEGDCAVWDPVEGAEEYILEVYRADISAFAERYTSDTRYDISEIYLDWGPGNHAFRVIVNFEEDYIMSPRSPWKAFEAPVVDLGAPANAVWKGTTARWDAAEYAENYIVTLYKDGRKTPIASFEEEETECNLGEILETYGSGTYHFEVQSSRAYNLRGPAVSDTMEYTATIEIPIVQNAHWDGHVAKWDPVEGAEGYNILVTISGDSTSGFGTFSWGDRGSYDLDDVLKDYRCGEFSFEISANWNHHSGGWSEPSEVLVYHESIKELPKVDPTCVKDGRTAGSKCTWCLEVLQKQEIIPATGKHTYTDKVTAEPTCTEAGTRTYTCSGCGDTYVETIAALGHDRIEKVTKEPTCAEAGEQTVTCSRCDFHAVEAVDALGHKEQRSTVTKATLTADGEAVCTCTVCGEERTEVIPAAKTVKLSATAYTYDGKVKSPTVTVTDAKGNKLVKDTDYTVSYASGRKTVGSYKVTVKGKGSYEFTKTLTFKINPVKTAISKLTAGSKSFTVKWSKKTKEVSGYQIQYSLKKNFSSSKTVTVSSAKTTAKTIKKLKGGKTYYVRIRTYKTVGKTKFYSDWSAAKSVKTKK